MADALQSYDSSNDIVLRSMLSLTLQQLLRSISAQALEQTADSTGELRATLAMCRHCFDVVIHQLHHGRSSQQQHHDAKPEFIHDLQDPTIACPLFVTWDKRKVDSLRTPNNNSRQFELRGCIGSLAPKPLVPAIREYALLSAFGDRRFPPIENHELQHLRVAVSLLVQYEPCQSVLDWLVGTHGIVLRWESKEGRQYSSTYLPEVAAEQKWNQKTTVESLIRKAGWVGPVTDALLKTIECTRYQSSKLRLTFEEYVAHHRGSGNVAFVEGLVGEPTGSLTEELREGRSNNCLIS